MTNLPTALITGASSGIGATYAERFARRGHNLVMVARDKARMDLLASRLREETKVTIDVIQADLTQQEDLAEIESRLREDTSIGILINNAGMGQSGAFIQQNAQSIDRLVCSTPRRPRASLQQSLRALLRKARAPSSTSARLLALLPS